MDLADSRILIIDDDHFFRQTLEDLLHFKGYEVATAGDGANGLERVQEEPFDLILLDFMMPRLTGKQVLQKLKEDAAVRHIPVIMLSSMDDQVTTVECIRIGAEDFLPKPVDAYLFYARVEAALIRKRWHDREQEHLAVLEAERARSERLLLNILPASIASRLKTGERHIVDHFAEATVLFADIVDFTQITSDMSPEASLQLLTEMFALFDTLAARHNLEKVKTVGDAYMVVGGVPRARTDHLSAVAEMALAMRYASRQVKTPDGEPLQIRLGFHAGPVVAGVLDGKKFSYDLWGDTVNVASRMEASSDPGMIQVTAVVHEKLQDRFHFQKRDRIPVKGKGEMQTYFLLGRRSATDVDTTASG